MKDIVFIDTEVSTNDNQAHDFGAVNNENITLHTGSSYGFINFISDYEFICGHNIIEHDAKFTADLNRWKMIDTLYLSPLLFPNRPYHKLLKDDKLQTDELNNPLNDAVKSKELFYDEVNSFYALDDKLKSIYYSLLKDDIHFTEFFRYIDYSCYSDPTETIREYFYDKICENSSLETIVSEMPAELAYCLALISASEPFSLLPRWVQLNYPRVDHIIKTLRGISCYKCEYCKTNLDPVRYLKKYFGYPGFRKYNDEPLQENAVNAAVQHKSLLAIFPTGGGKSLTFQIPAFIAGETKRSLTVVISPLQSLMKDQVDNLEKRGIADAVTINGLLSPIERSEAIERVASGMASILYISPESLRSVTIERLFLSRNIDRFVIDEAHCFSAWGQDFRVDYLYIGDFIRELQEKKGDNCRIPVSCFTATAKQKVVSDIKDYFKDKLDLELELYATSASRTNLRYEVLHQETESEKYETLRNLIELKNCPTIVYVSRTKKTLSIAEKLTNDGIKALPFNGKMESSEKQSNQEAFINDHVQVMVATSAFGMGVDKSNVKLVIHYDISDSLENYVQEAGRAGRDQNLQAECYVLFNDGDLDKHFMLLNQTKLSISEIQQVWKAVKELTKTRPEVCCSPLEVARQAGWDDNVTDIETRVKTAIQALENAGYLKRGKNVPRIYATSILVKSMIEASQKIEQSFRFLTDEERLTAKRIIQSLISCKSIERAGNGEAESRVDYISDRLGISRSDVIHSVQKMREDGLLADTKDLSAYIHRTSSENKSLNILKRFQEVEKFVLFYFQDHDLCMNYKELNEAAVGSGVKQCTVNSLKTLFYYWSIRGYIQKEEDSSINKVALKFKDDIDRIRAKRQKSYQLASFIVRYLYDKSLDIIGEKDDILVMFSVLDIIEAYRDTYSLKTNDTEVEEALLFMSKIDAMKLEGGFFVLYSGMKLERIKLDNKIRYKIEDYKQLNEFYKQKMQQIHIVGEYANMMLKSYEDALKFVNDYFQMDYIKFLSVYFSGERASQIERNITPGKYDQLFELLSPDQLEVIKDDTSKNIVISAGPGSGKTRVLVHKLASLLLLEDIKHEQLLMLTFSRASATEFKQRLRELIGNAANFVEIKTFHSYCFDLLGKIGNIQESDNVVKDAAELIINGDIDLSRITKSVLVIDEAQDMDSHEFRLVEALIEKNDDMRVIAVGDDDQNIYEFRGSSSEHLITLVNKYGAKMYSLIDNYRSSSSVVAFANSFASSLSERMKSEEIRSVTDKCGNVTLVKHTGNNMETALVNDLAQTAVKGTSCLLVHTNQEALVLLGILKSRNISAKLIQSMDGFDLSDIMEIRFFKKKLETEEFTPVISDELWDSAMSAMISQYSSSECLETVKTILQTFADNNSRKYRTDLDLFLHESKIEDFCKDELGVVTVSTLHKVKGREFDNVYMLLQNKDLTEDPAKRAVYVGITRAKKQLHIHYSDTFMDQFVTAASKYSEDIDSYDKPEKLIMRLTHKDVYLDYFKDKKKLILKLRSGMRLSVHGSELLCEWNGKVYSVLKFSAKCNEEIKRYALKGYKPVYARIRFICAWKGKSDEEECAVILADLYFESGDQ